MSDQAVNQNASGAPQAASVSEGTNSPAEGTVTLLGRPAATAGAIKALVAATGINPALVEFPADPWGFTRELRKVGLQAASSVRGQEDKQITLLGTLMILTAHVKARLEADKQAHADRQSEVETSFKEAEKYSRQYGIDLRAKADA